MNYVHYLSLRNFISKQTADIWLNLPAPGIFRFTTQKEYMSPSTIYFGPRDLGLFGTIESEIQKEFHESLFNKANHLF